MTHFRFVLVFGCFQIAASLHSGDKPAKVFILAGQSNMAGTGFVKADPNRNGDKAMGKAMMTLCATDAKLNAGDYSPDQSKLPAQAPKGAIVLFDAKGSHSFLSMSGEKIDWPIKDGVIVPTPKGNRNHIVSKLHFRDADIHVEFMLPEKGPGNSGVYIHGHYEVQILNSFGKETITQEDAGSLYGFSKPLVNACRKPGEWQVFDIRYRAPRRDKAGKITENGTVTVWFNGKKVQDGTEFDEPKSAFHPFRFGTTPFLEEIRDRQKKTMTGPVFLQDHGNSVKFRNVWVVPADDLAFIYEPGVIPERGPQCAASRDGQEIGNLSTPENLP